MIGNSRPQRQYEYCPKSRRMVPVPLPSDWRAPEHNKRTFQERDRQQSLTIDARPAILVPPRPTRMGWLA